MKISIITPNYNYSEYIGQTIQSVIDQDYDNWEHIIVDDGSTDDSLDVIKSYVRKYPQKIKLISQSNQGQAAAINVGFNNSTGDILAWINSDDVYCKNIFKFIVESFKNNNGADLVFGDIYKIDRQGNVLSQKKYLPFDFYAGCFLGFGNLVANNAAFFHSKVLDKTGLLNENLSYVLDSDFWFAFGKNAKSLKVNKPLGCFRIHKEAKSQNANLFLKEMKPLLREYYTHTGFSQYIPYSIGRNIKYYYLLKRYIYKLMNG